MGLKNSIDQFVETIVRIESGKKILNDYIKPLIAQSRYYYKISSFFSPSVIKSIFLELGACFMRNGHVKLIIGIHDSHKLIPILDELKNENVEDRFKLAVKSIIQQKLEEFISLLENPTDYKRVFTEMIRQALIQIRIASVKRDFDLYKATGQWPEHDSTFHPKVSIFKDDHDTVVMSGSINSTNRGFGENVEEAQFVASWFSANTVKRYEDIFEQIWYGNHEDSYTLEFNDEIKDILKEVVQKSTVIQENNWFDHSHLFRLVSESPLFYHYSYKQVRLLPHQYHVYKTLLSRWPVVGLIADEVGLGKTIETGAIISYLKKFGSVKNTALLIPSSLRFQWQREMYNLFGLTFYIYDSNSRSLIFSPNNDPLDIIENVNQGDYFNHGIENIIFSWHYIRSPQNGTGRLSKEDQIDLVVVDEAHAARIVGQLASETESTMLFSFLEHLFPSVRHKLLLTATPYQTNSLDYIALLRLLMGNADLENKSLERIAALNSHRRLNSQQKVDAIKELVTNKAYIPKHLSKNIDSNDIETLFKEYDEQKYLENHPTTVYTVRNTRDRLYKIGYDFPQVHIQSEAISISARQSDVINLATNYIENNLFTFESTLGVRGIGFVKTIYQQRIVSSFKACYDTFSSRSVKLQGYIDSQFIEGDVFLDIDDEDNISLNGFLQNRVQLSESQISIAQSELDYLNELLFKIRKRLLISNEISDPKVDKILELLKIHLSKNEKVIVFSRFTSTTNYIVEVLQKLNQFAIGRYQGDIKQIIVNGEIHNLDRQAISDGFNSNQFPVIICSDAASEGLNLQTANVIINVDVPWNPAKLLQRFGRVDRFGQKKKDIYFYNLFYPGTVEDRMYSRLHQRNTEFRELLGATPDITSQNHLRDLTHREVIGHRDKQDFSYRNSLISLSVEDNERIHELILNRFRLRAQTIINKTDISMGGVSFSYSVNELDEDYLDLNHEIFTQLPPPISNSKYKVSELRNEHGQFLFYCMVDSDKAYPLHSIKEILDYLILEKPFERNAESAFFSLTAIEKGFEDLLEKYNHQLIYHNQVRFINAAHNFYKGLFLENTDIKAICRFS